MTKKPSNVIIRYTDVFGWNKEAYDSGKYSLIINQGSSSSSKTYSIIQLLITIAYQEKKEIQICGPSYNRLARGAMKDFRKIMESWGLFKKEEWHDTKSKYTFPSGSYIEFFPLDSADIARGPRRDICFINEANLIAPSVFEQLNLRTNNVMFVDFNPADNYSYLYNLIDSDKPDIKFIKSTYKDNHFLDQRTIDAIEALPPDMFRIYGLGERGLMEHAIYPNYEVVGDIPRDEDGNISGMVFYGQDFNYSAPCAMVRIVYHEEKIYVDQMLYKKGLTTADLIKEYERLGINKYDEIFADSAAPAFIEEIHRAGYNIKKSKKDVREGIMKVKSFNPLFITQRSKDVIAEIKSYQWMLDKDDRPLDAPLKQHDHLMDAMRYAVYTYTTKPKYTWVAI